MVSQQIKAGVSLSVCVPLVYARFKQGSAFFQRYFAVTIVL